MEMLLLAEAEHWMGKYSLCHTEYTPMSLRGSCLGFESSRICI